MTRSSPTALLEAARAGDESAFTALAERYRRELQVHCYRMVGSLEDSEDLVQETFLRAWRSRETFSFEPGSSFRAWLYRIATNACLDALAHASRRLLPHQVVPPADPLGPIPEPTDGPWLEPYPDHLLEGIAPSEDEPHAAVVARETIEIAFIAAIQLLPPRQRAALILRDVLGWSAKETAALLDASVASANSALQRARTTLKQHLPARRLDWARSSEPNPEERAVLRRFVDAIERADTDAFAAVLREDVVASMAPLPLWFDGRDANVKAARLGLDPASPDYVGELRAVPAAANRQPTAAWYVRRPGEEAFRPFVIEVLRIEDGKVVEIMAFGSALFPAFGLPPTLG